jgi:hypothetical protein
MYLASRKEAWYMKTLVGFVLAISLQTVHAQENSWESVFIPAEELTYAVRWKFVRLGTITIRTYRDSASAEAGEIKVSMKVESNPDISLVTVWEWNESTIDAKALYSKRFRAIHRRGNAPIRTAIRYDESERTAHYLSTDYDTGRTLEQRLIGNVPPYVEGPGLFFLTRCYAASQTVLTVPTLINGKLGSTDLDFRGQVEHIKIKAVEAPVRTRTYTGQTNWDGGGVAGLAGDFTGWISDDESSVIVQAEMKILLGAIRLELESWNRPGWVPPSGPRTQAGSVADRTAPY